MWPTTNMYPSKHNNQPNNNDLNNDSIVKLYFQYILDIQEILKIIFMN